MLPEVTSYINSHPEWKTELDMLRTIVLKSPLQETLKWASPVYTYSGKNMVGIGAFKQYCAIWFFQGALLKDKDGILINAQEGKTKALRQWRFDNLRDIDENKILLYVNEAIENQKKGLEIKPETKKQWVLPEELQRAFHQNSALLNAFEKFTPGRQKEFAEYITEAKRENTRMDRLEKITPMIMAGIGLHDKYRNC